MKTAIFLIIILAQLPKVTYADDNTDQELMYQNTISDIETAQDKLDSLPEGTKFLVVEKDESQVANSENDDLSPSNPPLQLENGYPLGRGVKSGGKVLQLYCLEKDAEDPNVCIKAQYALFKEAELMPTDAFGNHILQKRSLTKASPVLSIEEGQKIKSRLEKVKNRLKYPKFKALPKIKFSLTKSWYTDPTKEGNLINKGNLTISSTIAGATGLLTVGVTGAIMSTQYLGFAPSMAAAFSSTAGIVGLSLVGAGITGIFLWPVVTDIAVNASKETFTLAVDAGKALETPAIVVVRGIESLFDKDPKKIANTFINKEGYNWSEKPMELSDSLFNQVLNNLIDRK